MTEISVIMPAYNAGKYIEQAIESILKQSFNDFEFLIINDASNDQTKTKILSFRDKRIKYIENKNRLGLTRSLNLGLNIAKGKYIARMDADDISLKDRLKTQFNYLENNKDIVLIGTWVEFFGNYNGPEKIWECPRNHYLIKYYLSFNNQLAHSSICFRRSDILGIGGYDNKYEYAQDYDLYARLIKHDFLLHNIGRVLAKYRVHDESRSFSETEWQRQADCADKIQFSYLEDLIGINQSEFRIFKRMNGGELSFIDYYTVFGIYHRLYQKFKYDSGIPSNAAKEIHSHNRNLKKILIKKAIKKILLLRK